jgi:hypothetical protein
MTILSAIRDRFSPPSPSASSASGLAREASAGAAGDSDVPPFDGYDRLSDRKVVHGLCDHSQIELEAVESYERSHKDRKPVLDKLRYMRGREPFPGYDALRVEEIVAALEEADLDLATIQRVRGYERKFANRSDVLEEAVRAQSRRQATQPASAAPRSAPRYQPTSARMTSARIRSSAPAPVDRPERSDRP